MVPDSSILETFIVLRFLPVSSDQSYWEQFPTEVLEKIADSFQTVAFSPRTRDSFIWTLVNIFQILDVNNERFRNTLTGILLEYYTKHPEQLPNG